MASTGSQPCASSRAKPSDGPPVDAHVAVGQDDGVRVLRPGRLDPGDGVLEPLGRDALAGVVHPAGEVADLGGGVDEQFGVGPLDADVDDVG